MKTAVGHKKAQSKRYIILLVTCLLIHSFTYQLPLHLPSSSPTHPPTHLATHKSINPPIHPHRPLIVGDRLFACPSQCRDFTSTCLSTHLSCHWQHQLSQPSCLLFPGTFPAPNPNCLYINPLCFLLLAERNQTSNLTGSSPSTLVT